MNNINYKGIKYKDNLKYRNRIDLNPTLTEKSTEKTLENNNIYNNLVSKKSTCKNILLSTNMNKTSKSSHLSDKELINLNTQKSKSKENYKNKSIDLRYKNNFSIGKNLSSLFKDSFSKHFKSTLSKNILHFILNN